MLHLPRLRLSHRRRCAAYLWLVWAFASIQSGALAEEEASEGESSPHRNGMAVVGYLPEWRYEGANWETISEHVTHLLLFSLEIRPDGRLHAFDRFPRKELYQQAREATRRHGTRLLICFGGNGRSAGFSPMVKDKTPRRRFLKELVQLIQDYDLDGVDYNWEYPGFQFGRGYLSDAEIVADYTGLATLVKETKLIFRKKNMEDKVITMAYYPDLRQEREIRAYGIYKYVDLMHMMTYDADGQQHSSMEFAEKSLRQGCQLLPCEKLTLGVPFYGRASTIRDWTTYEDLVQNHDPLDPDVNAVPDPELKGVVISFNGVSWMENKTRMTIEKKSGGIMIWEVGQDCRLVPITHGSKTHKRTCPKDESSLLLAITRARKSEGIDRMRLTVPASSSSAADRSSSDGGHDEL